MKGVACLGQHHSADKPLRGEHGFPGSPGLPIVEAKAALPSFGHWQISSARTPRGRSRKVNKGRISAAAALLLLRRKTPYSRSTDPGGYGHVGRRLVSSIAG